MKVSAIKSKTRQVEITYQGETVKVEYLVNALTPALQEEVQALEGIDSIVKQLHVLVVHWDVTDDAGTEYAITDENLRLLPTDFLVEILVGIVNDLKTWSEDQKKVLSHT
jgi:hypothetical protein